MTEIRFAYCVNGHGYGQVDENGLCLRRCLRSRKVRRQLRLNGTRKEVTQQARSLQVRKSEV